MPSNQQPPPGGPPDFSNVQSGTSSTAPAAEAASLPPSPAPPAPVEEPKTYTVAEGDSLWKVAHRVYGHGNQWQKIYEANKDRIQNPDLIHPGQTLIIPD